MMSSDTTGTPVSYGYSLVTVLFFFYGRFVRVVSIKPVVIMTTAGIHGHGETMFFLSIPYRRMRL